jgi:hypothetical protein
VMSRNCPASRAGRSEAHQPPAGGATVTSVGGSATGGALAPPAPRVVRRLAGLSAGAAEAELERRLRVELEAAAALRVDMVGWAARRNSLVVASSRARASGELGERCTRGGAGGAMLAHTTAVQSKNKKVLPPAQACSGARAAPHCRRLQLQEHRCRLAAAEPAERRTAAEDDPRTIPSPACHPVRREYGKGRAPRPPRAPAAPPRDGSRLRRRFSARSHRSS